MIWDHEVAGSNPVTPTIFRAGEALHRLAIWKGPVRGQGLEALGAHVPLAATDTCNVGVKGSTSTPFVSTKVAVATLIAVGSIKWPKVQIGNKSGRKFKRAGDSSLKAMMRCSSGG